MKFKKQIWIFLLITIIIFSNCVKVHAATLPSGSSTDDIGKQIETFVSEHQDTTAGMSVAVFDDKNTIYENCFGKADINNNLAVDMDTVFEWGSVSKLLVWVSVMQLWEQGKIDLNADVREYLPDDFLTNLKYDTPVTMTNLMNHNAGFEEVMSELFIKEGRSIPDLKSALLLHEPAQIYEPGTVTAYSNWGVALAGYIVECISNEPYDQYVREHIFQVLSMEHTAIRPDLSDNPWVQEKRKELQCYTTNVSQLNPGFYHISLYPAGMCTGTLNDFKSFAQALLQKDSPLFVNNTTREEMFSPTSYYGDTGVSRNCHGFWNIFFDSVTLGHGGNTAGCSSYLLLDLENNLGSVVMTNQSNETIYNTDMMKLIYGSFENSNQLKPTVIPKGIYRPARIVKVGPIKFLGALNFVGFDQSALNEFFSYQTKDGLGVVSYPYYDVLELPTGQLVFEIFLLAGFAIGLLVSIGYLLSWPISYFRRKRKKITKEISVSIKLRRISACLQWVIALMLLGITLLIITYENVYAYSWMSVVCGLTGIAMVVVFLLILRKLINKPSKKEIVFSIITMFFLVVAVLNIGYWNLFMFWKL